MIACVVIAFRLDQDAIILTFAEYQQSVVDAMGILTQLVTQFVDKGMPPPFSCRPTIPESVKGCLTTKGEYSVSTGSNMRNERARAFTPVRFVFLIKVTFLSGLRLLTDLLL